MLAEWGDDGTLSLTSFYVGIGYVFAAFAVLHFPELDRADIESSEVEYMLIVANHREIGLRPTNGDAGATLHKRVDHRNW